jgi:short-subunit dehydrogenase
MNPIRTALVTGASSGIGAAIARELAGSGWRLALTGRDEARLAAEADACRSCGSPDVLTATFDTRDAAAFADFVARTGTVDLFVANAGILDGRRPGDPAESRDAAMRVLEINLMASVEAVHAVLGGMLARGSGQILLVTSLAGLSPIADAPAYSASKAGLAAYGIALRDALAGTGVGVSVSCPGYVLTRMSAQHNGNRPQEITAEDAARRILKAGLRNKPLTGFPFPLYPAAHLALMMPDWMRRFFTKGLRFTMAG